MFYNRRVPLERLFVVCVRSIAQPGRALRSGRRGRRFESCYSDHKLKSRRPLGAIFNLSWSWLVVCFFFLCYNFVV